MKIIGTSLLKWKWELEEEENNNEKKSNIEGDSKRKPDVASMSFGEGGMVRKWLGKDLRDGVGKIKRRVATARRRGEERRTKKG